MSYRRTQAIVCDLCGEASPIHDDREYIRDARHRLEKAGWDVERYDFSGRYSEGRDTCAKCVGIVKKYEEALAKGGRL